MADVRRIGGRIHLRLNESERAALLDIVERLSPGVQALPAGRQVYDDEDLDEDYRRFVRPDLVQERDADIESVREALRAGEDTCALTEAHAYAWMRALNHLRLSAAALLGIDSDGWQEQADTATRERLEYRALIALAYIQEELVAALQS
ncbi:MAG: DUF2017 family protein [Candidatus Dormibacteria bacterium]